jgi:glycosyltransferase involved in cell wall biosynthesis
VSDVDANQFRALYGVKPKILANGVDPGRFSKLKKDDIYAVERQYNLTHPFMLFMGLIGYKPNDEAVSFLIEKILPRLINKKSDIKLVIIGGKVPYLESWLINPGIVPYEMVPALIQASDLCLAPIFSGSGTRLKILEYLAAGKPVVTTSKGAEGLDVLNGRDLVISDNEVAFEETILNLINDMDLSKRMGFQGRRTVAKKYSWQAIVRDFIVDVGLRAD